MTVESIYELLSEGKISVQDASKELESNKKLINYFLHRELIEDKPEETLTEAELLQLDAIVKTLQIIYSSEVPSFVSDEDYDILQETLVNYGIPRLTGTIEVNELEKSFHKYKNLRGTLSKVYFLDNSEKRVNKSRKYLSEWISSMENKYKKVTGKKIDLSQELVTLTPKFDGASAVLEVGDSMKWLTRGDTAVNIASDISHLMIPFNETYKEFKNCGIKFEVMCSNENLEKINELSEIKYKNTRQVVVSALNQVEMDFKIKYLTPIPLRIIKGKDEIESVWHEKLNYPEKVCKLSDIKTIRVFANSNRVVEINGEHYRTDGVVITFINPELKKVLGRDNDINNFEVAYKFTSEFAYSKVKDVEFYVSEFGFITPVVVFSPVYLKGNTVQKASISNKARFDELNLHYGDTIKVLYDIVPYITLDDYCMEMNK